MREPACDILELVANPNVTKFVQRFRHFLFSFSMIEICDRKLSQPYKSNLRNRYSSPLFVRLYLLFVRAFNRGFLCLTTNAALHFSFDHLTLLRVSAVEIYLENFYL